VSASAEPPSSAEEVRGRAAAGAVLLGLRSLAVRALGLAGNLVLARLLLPSEFGEIALGLAVISFSRFLMDGGVVAGLVRREQPPDHEELRAALGFHLAVALAILAVVAAVAPIAGTPGVIAAVMAVSLPIDAARAPIYVTFERRVDYGVIARVEVAEILVYNVLAVSAVALGAGVLGVAGAVIAKSLVGTAIALTRSPIGRLRPGRRWGRLRPVMRFGLTFQATTLVLLLREQAITALTLVLATTSVLGLFALANRLMLVGVVVFEAVSRVLFSALARLEELGERAGDSLSRVLSSAFVLCGLVAVPLAATAPALVPVLFGEVWRPSAPVVTWMASSFLFNAPLLMAAQSYFWATGRAGLVLRLTVAKSVLAVAIAAPLLPRLGAEAIGIGIFAASAVDSVVIGVLVVRATGVPLLRHIAPPLLAAPIAGVLGRVVVDAVAAETVAVLAGAATALAVYALLLLATYREPVNALGRQLAEVLGNARSGSVGRV